MRERLRDQRRRRHRRHCHHRCHSRRRYRHHQRRERLCDQRWRRLASLEHVVVKVVEHDRDDRADHGEHNASRHIDEPDKEAVNQVSAVGGRVCRRHGVARCGTRGATSVRESNSSEFPE